MNILQLKKYYFFIPITFYHFYEGKAFEKQIKAIGDATEKHTKAIEYIAEKYTKTIESGVEK